MSTEKIQIGNVMEQDVCVNKLTPSMPRNGTCKRVPIKFCLIISRVFLFLLRSAWRFLWFRKIKVHIRNGRRAKPTTTWFFFFGIVRNIRTWFPFLRTTDMFSCTNLKTSKESAPNFSLSLSHLFWGKKKPSVFAFHFSPCWHISYKSSENIYSRFKPQTCTTNHLVPIAHN